MVKSEDFVVWLQEVDRDDAHSVGVKSAHLGEMILSDFAVPEGLAITTNSYHSFLKANKLNEKIRHLIGTINFNNVDSIHQVSRHIRTIIERSPIPQEITKEIFSAYAQMMKKHDSAFVAIRSSIPHESIQRNTQTLNTQTFLNIKGEAAVVDTIRKIWASLFLPQAISHRNNAKVDQLRMGMGILVQKMVQSEVSGTAYSIDPLTYNKQRIIIEAFYGLSEYVSRTKIPTDHYEIDKNDFKITDKKIAPQNMRLIFKKGENVRERVPDRIQNSQKLSDQNVEKLSKMVREIENHYYFPQSIEWAYEKGKLYVLATRPLTTIQKPELKSPITAKVSAPNAPLLLGQVAYRGIVVGKVKIIHSLKDLLKTNSDDILVTSFTTPEYIPFMKRVAGLVVENSGNSSHAAVFAREFQIPTIIGAIGATKRLSEGSVVTLHGGKGEVYAGSIVTKYPDEKTSFFPKTATQVFINISDPENAREIAAMPIDGVGMFKGEHVFAKIGVHPKKLLEKKRERYVIERIAEHLEKVCAAFYPRPVFYRSADLTTDEYRDLVGGAPYEPKEVNPQLGFRGANRSIRNPKVFSLELAAIKHIREKKGFTNLHLMLPFVRTVYELREMKKIIRSHDLRRSSLFKLFMMIEVPSNVILIEKFINEGIDGISINSNSLTKFTLGIDRGNEEMLREFNPRDNALMWMYERVIDAAKAHKIESLFNGAAVTEFPNLVQRLVEMGIGSVSVFPHATSHTREIIQKTEYDIIQRNG